MEVNFRKILRSLLALVVAFRLVFPFVVVAQTIEGNNSNSDNTVTQNVSDTQTVAQTNEADIGTSVSVALSTGENSVSSSTGESVINTGDTSFSASVETAANTSVVDTGCCDPSVDNAVISDNNSNSSNTTTTNTQDDTNIEINQNAQIANEFNVTLSTGGNTISDSSGTSSITSGDVKVRGEINNGPINYANVTVGDPSISVSSVITNNNWGSTNTIYSSVKKSSDIDINNLAEVKNLLSFILDSGNNVIENNMGSSQIITGDIFFVFKIDNGPINVSEVTYACCDACDDPVTPTPTITPTPVPTSAVGGGGDSGSTSSGSDSSGSSDSSSSVEQRVAAMVLGATGSFMENLFYLMFGIGCMFLAFGIRNFDKEKFALSFASGKSKLTRHTLDFFNREIALTVYFF